VRHPAHATSELVDVVSLVTQAFWAELRKSGETIEISQWSTLKRISRSPCTMSELARYKGVGLPTISKSVDMLVRRSLVERWVDKGDRRQTLVRLTPAGKRLLLSCRKALEAFLDKRLASLTEAERDAIDHSLQLVRRVLTV
jgi:DNA-binding MarR family transcriptional regulator